MHEISALIGVTAALAIGAMSPGPQFRHGCKNRCVIQSFKCSHRAWAMLQARKAFACQDIHSYKPLEMSNFIKGTQIRNTFR
jgi:hypothetical protein